MAAGRELENLPGMGRRSGRMDHGICPDIRPFAREACSPRYFRSVGEEARERANRCTDRAESRGHCPCEDVPDQPEKAFRSASIDGLYHERRPRCGTEF